MRMLSQSPTEISQPQSRLLTLLWKGGIGVWVFVLTLVVGNFFIPTERAVTPRMLGHDFLPFYYAGTAVRTGQIDKLYDLDAMREFETRVSNDSNLELNGAFGPWWNPPFAAWLFAPFSALSYYSALHYWWLFGIACLSISIFLMCRMLKGGWKSRALVPLFLLSSMPFFQAMGHGQNTFFSLLLLTITVTFWRSGRALAAGLACGFLFYKPQLGAVVAVILALSQGRRAILGVAITGTVLLLINLLTLPGTIHQFLIQMPQNLHWMMEENHYRWERHITFKGFWRITIQGWAMGPTSPIVIALWGICEISLLCGLFAVVLKTMRQTPSAIRTDRLIAVAIVSMPLLMPFYFDYDLLLISVGVVVYAADFQRTASSGAKGSEDRWLPGAWAALFLVMEIGTMLAGYTRIHLAVPAVSVIAVLLIRRALRPEPNAAATILPDRAPPVALAA
jgi:hypothetical protein